MTTSPELIVHALRAMGIPVGTSKDERLPVLDIDATHKYLLSHVLDDEDEEEIVAPTSISISPLHGGEIRIPNVEPSMTIGGLKLLIHNHTGLHPRQQRLCFGGNHLGDDQKITSGMTYGQLMLLAKPTDVIQKDSNEVPGDYRLVDKYLDPQFNYTYPSSGSDDFSRGKVHFQRPYGWSKVAIKVLGRYGNDDWLGTSGSLSRNDSVPGEWPVSYHGTQKVPAKKIAEDGFDPKKLRRQLHGEGFYSAPNPRIAEDYYAQSFAYKGERYKVILMNRINPNSYEKVWSKRVNDWYYITPKDKNRDLRPYAFLIKKM